MHSDIPETRNEILTRTTWKLHHLMQYLYLQFISANLVEPMLVRCNRIRWVAIFRWYYLFILFYKWHWTWIGFLSSLADLTHFIGKTFRGGLYILFNYTFSEQLLLQNIMFIMCREKRNLNQKKECNFCKLAAKIHDLVRNKALPNVCQNSAHVWEGNISKKSVWL